MNTQTQSVYVKVMDRKVADIRISFDYNEDYYCTLGFIRLPSSIVDTSKVKFSEVSYLTIDDLRNIRMFLKGYFSHDVSLTNLINILTK